MYKDTINPHNNVRLCRESAEHAILCKLLNGVPSRDYYRYIHEFSSGSVNIKLVEIAILWFMLLYRSLYYNLSLFIIIIVYVYGQLTHL